MKPTLWRTEKDGLVQKESRIDDVMRTPSNKDLSARTLCNLPTSFQKLPLRKEEAQPAIGIRSFLGFLNNIDESPNQTDAAMYLL